MNLTHQQLNDFILFVERLKLKQSSFFSTIFKRPSRKRCCFDQLLHHKLQVPFKSIFVQAKFLEIFSLIMETAFGQHMEACPVMMTPAIESKIHEVRRHIISHIDTVPDPDHLALVYELPRNTLKEGHRYIFDNKIH